MIVTSVNILLIILARRILHAFYHNSDTSPGFRYRVNIFRVFNVLIIVLYTYYHLYSDVDADPASLKLLSVIFVLYLCYAGSHITHYMEAGVLDAGDHAVKWGMYYYTKDIRGILVARQKIREHVLKASRSMNISLATPVGVLRHNSLSTPQGHFLQI